MGTYLVGRTGRRFISESKYCLYDDELDTIIKVSYEDFNKIINKAYDKIINVVINDGQLELLGTFCNVLSTEEVYRLDMFMPLYSVNDKFLYVNSYGKKLIINDEEAKALKSKYNIASRCHNKLDKLIELTNKINDEVEIFVEIKGKEITLYNNKSKFKEPNYWIYETDYNQIGLKLFNDIKEFTVPDDNYDLGRIVAKKDIVIDKIIINRFKQLSYENISVNNIVNNGIIEDFNNRNFKSVVGKLNFRDSENEYCVDYMRLDDFNYNKMYKLCIAKNIKVNTLELVLNKLDTNRIMESCEITNLIIKNNKDCIRCNTIKNSFNSCKIDNIVIEIDNNGISIISSFDSCSINGITMKHAKNIGVLHSFNNCDINVNKLEMSAEDFIDIDDGFVDSNINELKINNSNSLSIEKSFNNDCFKTLVAKNSIVKARNSFNGKGIENIEVLDLNECEDNFKYYNKDIEFENKCNNFDCNNKARVYIGNTWLKQITNINGTNFVTSLANIEYETDIVEIPKTLFNYEHIRSFSTRFIKNFNMINKDFIKNLYIDKLIIDRNIETIEDGAIEIMGNCNNNGILTEVSIGSSVKNISAKAFVNKSKIRFNIVKNSVADSVLSKKNLIIVKFNSDEELYMYAYDMNKNSKKEIDKFSLMATLGNNLIPNEIIYIKKDEYKDYAVNILNMYNDITTSRENSIELDRSKFFKKDIEIGYAYCHNDEKNSIYNKEEKYSDRLALMCNIITQNSIPLTEFASSYMIEALLKTHICKKVGKYNVDMSNIYEVNSKYILARDFKLLIIVIPISELSDCDNCTLVIIVENNMLRYITCVNNNKIHLGELVYKRHNIKNYLYNDKKLACNSNIGKYIKIGDTIPLDLNISQYRLNYIKFNDTYSFNKLLNEDLIVLDVEYMNKNIDLMYLLSISTGKVFKTRLEFFTGILSVIYTEYFFTLKKSEKSSCIPYETTKKRATVLEEFESIYKCEKIKNSLDELCGFKNVGEFRKKFMKEETLKRFMDLDGFRYVKETYFPNIVVKGNTVKEALKQLSVDNIKAILNSPICKKSMYKFKELEATKVKNTSYQLKDFASILICYEVNNKNILCLITKLTEDEDCDTYEINKPLIEILNKLK